MHRVVELSDLLASATRSDGLRYAMLRVIGQELESHAFECGPCRIDLGEDVDAVAILGDDLLHVLGVAWHPLHHTPRRYSSLVRNHDMVMRSPHEVMGHGGHAEMSMDAMAGDMRNRFLVAAVLSVPILLWSSIGRQVLHFEVPGPFGLRDDVFQLILSVPVIGYSGWIFFDGAVRALRARTLDMMVLVAVAIAAGWTYSVVITLRGGGDVFYEASTVLCAFVLLGHWLEMRA